MNLEASSRRLENLSDHLLTLTGLLAVFTLTSILSTIYINYEIPITYERLASALKNFIPFFLISAIIIILSIIFVYGGNYIRHNKKGKKMNTRQITGFVLIIVAIVILVLSYNAYLTSYHKTISTSNFTFLFSGIFWDLVGILIGAVLIAIGLILAYPKGARWIANRNR